MEDMIVGAGLLAAAANIIMQLSWPEVGYGVFESTVDSGNVFRHPLKRNRTTLTYIAVAALGTEEERKTYRTWVNKSHRQVRSTESSPVKYNAFDPELQLWVAACLYMGFEDIFRLLGGLDEAARDEVYQSSATLGTTLQVRPDMWPADRAAFAEYWEKGLDRVHIDDSIRGYLTRLSRVEFLPAVVHRPLGRWTQWLTAGFLPPRFRDEMRFEWSDRDQRRFERLLRAIGAVAFRLPGPLRRCPFNYYLWNLRARIRLNLPLT
ncbi:MAG: oxygenase MpaB family protein [Streptosporangiales bacterium]|nr:oxygenase MpaB family protein [Streptosporangiales bacterium]